MYLVHKPYSQRFNAALQVHNVETLVIVPGNEAKNGFFLVKHQPNVKSILSLFLELSGCALIILIIIVPHPHHHLTAAGLFVCGLTNQIADRVVSDHLCGHH